MKDFFGELIVVACIVALITLIQISSHGGSFIPMFGKISASLIGFVAIATAALFSAVLIKKIFKSNRAFHISMSIWTFAVAPALLCIAGINTMVTLVFILCVAGWILVSRGDL